MPVVKEGETSLMFLATSRELVPVAHTAFEVAQDSEGRLNAQYRGATVVSRDGTEATIERVVVGGLFGDSLPRRFRSALFGTRRITVQFSSEQPCQLTEFKRKTLDCLESDAQRPEPYLDVSRNLEAARARVAAAATVQDVFVALDIPSPEDALDVL